MGSAESKEIEESVETKHMKEVADKGGPAAVQKYIVERMNRWKKEKVKFGVTGRSATGKSSFINAIRGVGPKDEGFARSGSGNTTLTPTEYHDPKNTVVIYCDLPGVASLKFPKEQYVSRMNLEAYDYFFIFFDKVIGEDEKWLVKTLKGLGKPLCLVRSKIDDDRRNARYDGNDPDTVVLEIRTKAMKAINDDPELVKEEIPILLISSRQPTLEDMPNLVNHVRENLSSIKYEAVFSSLSLHTENIIEHKYDMLKKRIPVTTALTTITAAVPIPGLDFAVNMGILASEIKHYIDVFGLTKEKVTGLSGVDTSELKCKDLVVSKHDLSSLLSTQLLKFSAITAFENVAELALPVIGSIISAITTGVIVYKFLNEKLEDLRHDTYTVYKSISILEHEK